MEKFVMSCQSFIKKKGCDNDEKEKNNWNYRLGAYISYCAFLCGPYSANGKGI